jgi:hypothetical protein
MKYSTRISLNLLLICVLLFSQNLSASGFKIKETDIKICDSDQGKCLRIASNYISTGRKDYGLEMLRYRASGGEVTDIFNYAINLKKTENQQWLELMKVAAGLGDSEAQIELADFYFLENAYQNKIKTKFINYFVATHEEDGEFSCIRMVKLSIELNDTKNMLLGLRRNRFFCQIKLRGSLAEKQLIELENIVEKKLSPIAMTAWKKYKSININ